MNRPSIPNADFANVGAFLRYLRRRARLSQRELSIAVGYSESHLSRIENNERPIDRTSLLAIFVPALGIQHEPETIARLLTLCEGAQPLPAVASPASPPPQPTAEALPTNRSHLPAQLTSFVGRTEEMTEVCGILADTHTRLLSLTGAGGCGKTRLALRVGEEIAPVYGDGVWLVELAALTESAGLPKAVAALFGLRDEGESTPFAGLVDFLHPRHLLLILDNCEHLIDGAAQLATALLQACPDLQILATSRERFATPGEIVYPVQPLALPPGLLGGRSSRAAVEGFDAIRLFVERAKRVRSGFALSDQNAPAVARICQRLDGIPLAIELAAAWISLLTPEQIAARLERDFDLLAGHSRVIPLRHQTLAAAMGWSYDLLAERERVLLQRLSVFAGGWTVEAAEAVAGGLPPLAEKEVLSLLDRLAGNSLVVLGYGADNGARFRMLETIREYARRKLAESGEEEPVRERHLAWFAALAERAAEDHRAPAYQKWLAALDQEQENLRAALEYLHLGQMEERELRLVVALAPFWCHRGDYSEGRRQLAAALARAPQPSLLRSQVLLEAGRLAGLQGDMAAARALSEESLTHFRLWKAVLWEAQALENLGWSWSNEDRQKAAGYFQESLALYQAQHCPEDSSRLLTTLAQMAREEQHLADARSYLAQALESAGPSASIPILHGLAELASLSGDYEEAARLLTLGLASIDRAGSKQERAWSYCGLAENCWHRGAIDEGLPYAEKSVSFFRELGSSSGLAIALHHLGLLWLALERPEMAADALGESLRLCQTNCLHFMAARCLVGLAGVALAEGDGLRAVRLLDAAEPQLTRRHQLLTPADRSFYSQLREDSRARLGQAVGHAL